MKKDTRPYVYTMECGICEAEVEVHVLNESEHPLPLCIMCGEEGEWDSSDE